MNRRLEARTGVEPVKDSTASCPAETLEYAGVFVLEEGGK